MCIHISSIRIHTLSGLFKKGECTHALKGNTHALKRNKIVN